MIPSENKPRSYDRWRVGPVQEGIDHIQLTSNFFPLASFVLSGDAPPHPRFRWFMLFSTPFLVLIEYQEINNERKVAILILDMKLNIKVCY